MKGTWKYLITLCALATLLAASSAARITVPQSEIDAETARWTALGVKLPPGGIVIAHPYDPPYSNRSFVVPWSWFQRFYSVFLAKHEYPVRASALRADLPVLRLLMERAYSGYEPAKRRGWNFERWFANWDAMLRARRDQTLSIGSAFAPWGDFERFQLDNHSGVVGYQAFVSGSASAQLARTPVLPCTALLSAAGRIALHKSDPGQEPHSVVQWDGSAFSPAWYVSFPKRDWPVQTIECGGARIALRAVPTVSGLTQQPSYETLGDGIAYVRMANFSDAGDDQLRSVLSKASGLGKERLVVLDLRGNGGGSAPVDVLNNWAAQSAIDRASSFDSYETESCFVTALRFNLQMHLMRGLKAPLPAPELQFLQQSVNELAQPPNCEVRPVTTRGESPLRDHRFTVKNADPSTPRLVALVDSGCGSDCELMTKVVASLPNSVIAGSSTYGVMGFTRPGFFILPHSGVSFRLALGRADAYGDGRSVDGYGISVDVLLPDARSQSRESIAALALALVR